MGRQFSCNSSLARYKPCSSAAVSKPQNWEGGIFVCKEAYKDSVYLMKYAKEADNYHGIGQGRFTTSVEFENAIKHLSVSLPA